LIKYRNKITIKLLIFLHLHTNNFHDANAKNLKREILPYATSTNRPHSIYIFGGINLANTYLINLIHELNYEILLMILHINFVKIYNKKIIFLYKF